MTNDTEFNSPIASIVLIGLFLLTIIAANVSRPPQEADVAATTSAIPTSSH